MTKGDREALTRALAIARRDRDMRAHLKGMPWGEAAVAAVYHCQIQALRLQPWESPPMYAENSNRDLDQGARILLRRMLDAGLSRYEPDPMAALKKKTPAS